MKQLLIIFIFAMLAACSKRDRNAESKVDVLNLMSAEKDSTAIVRDINIDEIYLTSTYDLSNIDLESHRAGLKELSDSGVFSIIHETLFLILSKKHQDHFNAKPDYSVLYSTTGDLFQNNKEDNVFVVYDKGNSRVSILVYDELKKSYSELFRGIKVKYGLETADCNYGAFGTLDYQIANELVYQRDYLIKKPESHLEYSECKIINISEDEDMILDKGCFAKNFSPEQQSKSFCIPTSSVYNNWECLTYDKSKNIFIVFYGQAFAD